MFVFLLGKVSQSARLFRRWKKNTFCERVSVGFLKEAELENLAFHSVCLFFYLACKSGTQFQISATVLFFYPVVHTHFFKGVQVGSRLRYYHLVTQLQNGSLLLEMLLQVIYHSCMFRAFIFLLHFFLFHFQLTFLITHQHSVELMPQVMLLNG